MINSIMYGVPPPQQQQQQQQQQQPTHKQTKQGKVISTRLE